MNDINKTIIDGHTIIYDGPMLNRAISFIENDNLLDGILWAKTSSGWTSIGKIPNYKEMKQEIIKYKQEIYKYKNFINQLDSMVKLNNENKELRKRIAELEDIIHDRLGKKRCAHCEKVFGNGDTDEIIHEHFITCEKSPVAIALKNANSLNQGLAEGMDLAIEALKAARITIKYHTRTNYGEDSLCRVCESPLSCEHDRGCTIKETLRKINCVIDFESNLPVRNDKIICAYCHAEFDKNQRSELANHIMTCDESPLVQCIESQRLAIDLLITNIDCLIAHMHPMIDARQKEEAIKEANESIKLIKKNMDILDGEKK